MPYFCFVKLLFFILTVYTLLLPCLPCADDDECNETAKTEMRSTNSQQHEHESEICNPFCNCDCCGQIFTTGFQPVKFTSHKPVAQKQQFFYDNTAVSSSFLGNIWQPPRYS
jgi:hypothetical protein